MASPSPDYMKEDSHGDFREPSPPPPPPPDRSRSRSRSPATRRDRSPTTAAAGSSRRDRSPKRDRSPRRDRSKSPQRDEPRGSTIHISGLSSRTSEDDLERKMAKYGKVSCKLVTDPRSRESRGFGFITVETPEVMQEIIDAMNNSEIDGRKVTLEQARRDRPRSPTPGKYLGANRVRRDVGSRPSSSSYGYGGYGRSGGGGGGGGGGGRYAPYPSNPYPSYGYGYAPYPPSYSRSSYAASDRYSPYRGRDRSPMRASDRSRYSPPPPPLSSSYRARDHSPSAYYRPRSPRGGERDYAR